MDQSPASAIEKTDPQIHLINGDLRPETAAHSLVKTTGNSSEYRNQIDVMARHHGYIELRDRRSQISFQIVAIRVNCRLERDKSASR